MLNVSLNSASATSDTSEFVPPTPEAILESAFGEVHLHLKTSPVTPPRYEDQRLPGTRGILRAMHTRSEVCFRDGSSTDIELNQVSRARIDGSGSFLSYESGNFCFKQIKRNQEGEIIATYRVTTLEAASLINSASLEKTGESFGFDLGPLPERSEIESWMNLFPGAF